MADQNQGQGNQGGQQGQRQRPSPPPPPPRLVITHHEFGRKPKKHADGVTIENPVTIWVIEENSRGREEVYCSFRVNKGEPTQEQLLGVDNTCTEILRFQGLRPYVEVMLRWRHDQTPQWRPLGYMEFKDPYRDPNDDLLFQRMFMDLWNLVSRMRADIRERRDQRRTRRQQKKNQRNNS